MDDLTRLAWTRTDPDEPGRTRIDPDGPGRTQTDPDGPGRTRMDPDRTGRTRTEPDGFHWVPLGSAGFYYTDVFNDRLLGANLQLVPGCHTLAA